MATPKIYVSYAWEVEEQNQIVSQLQQACQARGIELIRDSSHLAYGASIGEFMAKLGQGEAVVVILSQAYFESEYCMFELNLIHQQGYALVLPIVIEGTPFREASERLKFVNYWYEKEQVLSAQIAAMPSHLVSASHDTVRKYHEFAFYIDNLQSWLADKNALSQAIHLQTNFAALTDSLIARFPGLLQPNSTTLAIHYGGVPQIPIHYLNRSHYLTEIKQKLLAAGPDNLEANGGNNVGLAGDAQLGIKGMGGIGKSVLAAAIAADLDIRRAFPDGIFWLKFGQSINPDNVLSLLNSILWVVGNYGQSGQTLPVDIGQAQNQLAQLMPAKRCLMILDDVWSSRYVAHFTFTDSPSRYLLTTREAKVVEQLGAELLAIDCLSVPDAQQLLCDHCKIALADCPPAMAEIIKACGYLPIAIAAIGCALKGKPLDFWLTVLKRLKAAELRRFKPAQPQLYQYDDLHAVFEVSIEALDPNIKHCFDSLVIFAEDVAIPQDVLKIYWQYSATDEDVYDVLATLCSASLLNEVSQDSGDSVYQLHDLLRDFLQQSVPEQQKLNFHQQLFDAYKSHYPAGWHTIPYQYPLYFYPHWISHIKALGDKELAYEIADSLIKKQPLLSVLSLQESLKWVDYELAEIAKELLLNSQAGSVQIACLKMLGDKAKGDAWRLLKTSQMESVIVWCLKLLGDEAKEEARDLLQTSQSDEVIMACLKLLGEQAKNDARDLLKTSQMEHVIVYCLKLLGDEAKDDARDLLKTGQSDMVILACLKLLGDEAKDDARDLLKTSQMEHVIVYCLKLLGDEAKDDARDLLKTGQSDMVILTCLKLLGDEAKDDARELLKTSKNAEVLLTCLKLLGDEVRNDARELLKTSNLEQVILTCLKLLGDEAKPNARDLLKTGQSDMVILTCLKLLGDEAKDDALKLLKTSNAEQVILTCLKLLGDAAKTAAHQLLTESNNFNVRTQCLMLLKDQALVEIRALYQGWNTLKQGQKAQVLAINVDLPQRAAKAQQVLQDWGKLYRGLVFAAITVFAKQPQQVQAVCSNILKLWQKDIEFTISNNQKKYTNHIAKALTHPALQAQAKPAAIAMLAKEQQSPGFLGDYLLSAASKLVEGNPYPWDPAVNGENEDGDV